MTLLEELCASFEPAQHTVPPITSTGGDSTDSCWVARAVYGEENPRWIQFRQWLLTEAPQWFRKLYLRHGRQFAGWVAPHEGVKSVIRRWMDFIVDRR